MDEPDHDARSRIRTSKRVGRSRAAIVGGAIATSLAATSAIATAHATTSDSSTDSSTSAGTTDTTTSGGTGSHLVDPGSSDSSSHATTSGS